MGKLEKFGIMTENEEEESISIYEGMTAEDYALYRDPEIEKIKAEISSYESEAQRQKREYIEQKGKL